MTVALLWTGPLENAIVAVAARAAAAAAALDAAVRTRWVPEPGTLPGIVDELPTTVDRVHLHVNDWLFTRTPGGASVVADLGERLHGRGGRLALTLHDVPDPNLTGELADRRRRDYASMSGAADLLLVSSRHEADRLHRLVGTDAAVIPLPIDDTWDGVATPAGAAPTVGILGFVYPGKGHAEVIAELAGLPVTVVALGRPSDGQEYLLDRLDQAAARADLGFECTGYLPDEDLAGRMRTTGVPLAPHQQVSASASMNHWIAQGRRPLVAAGGYADELAERLPGAVHRYLPGELAPRVRAALADPGSTWRRPGDAVGPSTADTARMLLDLLEGPM